MYVNARKITEQCLTVDTLQVYACKHAKVYRIYIRTQILPPSMEYTGCSAWPQLPYPQLGAILLYFCCLVFQPPSSSQPAYSEPLQKERTEGRETAPIQSERHCSQGQSQIQTFGKVVSHRNSKSPLVST